MKVGESIMCPHCGRDSFVMKESLLDGFRKTGEVFKCAMCKAKLADVPQNQPSGKPLSGVSEARSNKALLDLLGEKALEHKNPFADVEKRFCRDCVYRVVNAFRIRCSKHDTDVGPMDDCKDFKRRAATEE